MCGAPVLKRLARLPDPIAQSKPLMERISPSFCYMFLLRHSVPAWLPRNAPPAGPHPAPQEGSTALMLAALNGHQKCMVELIVAGSDCSAKTRVRRFLP